MDWAEEEAQGFGKEPEFHEIEKVGSDLVVGRQLFDLLTPILVESAAICGPGLRIDLEGRGESGAHCEERVSKFVTDVAVKPRHCFIETLVQRAKLIRYRGICFRLFLGQRRRVLSHRRENKDEKTSHKERQQEKPFRVAPATISAPFVPGIGAY